MVRFLWDEDKNRANLKKHGVDFDDAVRAWHDPDRMDFFDGEHGLDETRGIFLGAVAGVVLLVVETKPEGNTVRIISARPVLKHEQEAYYANRGKNPQ